MDKTIHECCTGYTTPRNEMGRWLKQSMLLDPPGPHATSNHQNVGQRVPNRGC